MFVTFKLSSTPMSIFYEDEHKTCYNYNVPELSLFKWFELDKTSPPVFLEVEKSVLIFVVDGLIEAQFGSHRTEDVGAGQFFFVPSGVHFYGSQHCRSRVMSCSFADTPQFCNLRTIDTLAGGISDDDDLRDMFYTLPIRPQLRKFIDFVAECLADGIHCAHFHQLKLQEMFLLMRVYYTKDELARMFAPILGCDNEFRRFVLAHYKEVAGVEQFAEAANMSVSTFQRKFKQTFKKPVAEWLLDRKCEMVIREIKTSSKTFDQIADECSFSSVQYFSNFCKSHFGKTPTELRSEEF